MRPGQNQAAPFFGINAEKQDMIVAYHSCGSIRPIIGELAEIGIDVLNPIQESAADMDQKEMNYLALKGEVSDFSLKNLSLDRKLSILRGFIPHHLCGSKRFALKSGVLHPRRPIKEAYGEKLTFMCGLDTQVFLTGASPKDVYSRMMEKAQILSKGGGYIGAVSHTVQHDIPVENIRALVQALDDFEP